MANRVSQYGRKWNALVPRGAIRHHMGNVHISTTAAEVEADIREAIARSKDTAKFTPAIAQQCVDFALECHKRNLALYNRVMR